MAERVRELKETTKGVQKMCREMERIYQEGLMIGESRGVKRGERKKAQEMAISMSKRGTPVSEIAEIANVKVKVVKKWLSGSVGAA